MDGVKHRSLSACPRSPIVSAPWKHSTTTTKKVSNQKPAAWRGSLIFGTASPRRRIYRVVCFNTKAKFEKKKFKRPLIVISADCNAFQLMRGRFSNIMNLIQNPCLITAFVFIGSSAKRNMNLDWTSKVGKPTYRRKTVMIFKSNLHLKLWYYRNRELLFLEIGYGNQNSSGYAKGPSF